MTSFISPAAKNLAAFIGTWTYVNAASELDGDRPLQQLLSLRNEFFNLNAPVPSLTRTQKTWSVVYLSKRVTSALSLRIIKIFLNFWTINGLISHMLKSPIKRCSNAQIALVASACLALYAGIKRYVSEESWSGFFASRSAEAIGKGALIGLLAQFKPYLALVSMFFLRLADDYRTPQENERFISIILDEKNTTPSKQSQYLRAAIDRLFLSIPDYTRGEDDGIELEPEDKASTMVTVIDRPVIGTPQGDLFKKDLLRLLPSIEPSIEITKWSELSLDAKINMAFLRAGSLVSITRDHQSLSKQAWVRQFIALCKENSSLQERKQLVLDYPAP